MRLLCLTIRSWATPTGERLRKLDNRCITQTTHKLKTQSAWAPGAVSGHVIVKLLYSWLDNRNSLTSRKSRIYKYLQCCCSSGSVKQVVNEVITIVFNPVVVYLAHLRAKNRRRKPMKEGRKCCALQRHALNFVFSSHSSGLT